MTDEFIATENGNIRISEDVIVRISAFAAREVDGVAGLGTASAWGEFLGKKAGAKGIKVETTDDGTVIDVHVTVKFGVKINDVAKNLQQAVKNAVEAYAGLENTTINIYVDGIEAEKESDSKADSAEDSDEE